MNYSKIFAFLREQKAFSAFMTTLVVISSVSAVFYAKSSMAANPTMADTWQFQQVSDTLDTAQAGYAANHVIKFQVGNTGNLTETGGASTPVPLGNGNQPLNLSITMKGFGTSTLPLAGDFTVTSPGGNPLVAQNATVDGNGNLVLNFQLPANKTIAGGGQIQIQTNSAKIVNPPVAGAYQMNILATANNLAPVQTFKANTLTAIVSNVHMSAAIDPILSFTVNGVSTGTNVDGVTTNVTTSSSTIDFGTVSSSSPKIGAQALQLKTNASQGFVVTVKTDGPFQSANGEKIYGLNNGTVTASAPQDFNLPTLDLSNKKTFGSVGMSSACLNTAGPACDTSFAAANKWVGDFADDTPVPEKVMGYSLPTDGIGNNGSTTVVYQVKVTDLQPAATDYKANLIYVATPTF